MERGADRATVLAVTEADLIDAPCLDDAIHLGERALDAFLARLHLPRPVMRVSRRRFATGEEKAHDDEDDERPLHRVTVRSRIGTWPRR